MYCYHDYSSPVGIVVLASDEENLLGIWFRHQHPDLAFLKDPEGRHLETEPIRQGKAWLDRYFQHQRPEIAELPVTLTGTPFRKRVWQLLTQIPYGETVTYGSLARQIAAETGKPVSAQAVGGAVGHNPLSIVLPCHRVVGADGSLTGYAGGLETKAWLLAHEHPQ